MSPLPGRARSQPRSCRGAPLPLGGACPAARRAVRGQRKPCPQRAPTSPRPLDTEASSRAAPDRRLTGSRLSCQSDTVSSEWPAHQSLRAGVLFGSSALRPFGPSALRPFGPSVLLRSLLLGRPGPSAALGSLVLLGLISPFFSDTSGSCRRSGSPRVPEAWIIQVLLGEAKLPRKCLRESYVERGRFADS